jgi:leader peptidase (prepilin peptidase)/N-methyltransferase
VTGRSHCMHCKKVLSPTDLIPIISWIILRGRCRYCKGNISMQYPLVEALTASLFFLVGLSPLPLALQMLGLVIVSTCVAIAIYDVRFMLIPDLWSYVFSFSALLTGAFMANSAFDFLLLTI